MKKIGLVLMVFMPVFWGCQEEEVAAGYENSGSEKSG